MKLLTCIFTCDSQQQVDSQTPAQGPEATTMFPNYLCSKEKRKLWIIHHDIFFLLIYYLTVFMYTTLLHIIYFILLKCFTNQLWRFLPYRVNANKKITISERNVLKRHGFPKGKAKCVESGSFRCFLYQDTLWILITYKYITFVGSVFTAHFCV